MDRFADVRSLFEKRYSEVYSFAAIDAPIEIINWKVIASGTEPIFKMNYGFRAEDKQKINPMKGTREVYTEPSGYELTPIYNRYLLSRGMEIKGPAIIEERESTCVITAGSRAIVDQFLNIVAELDVV